MNWLNSLSPWQWAALATVPPLIVMLYFLKLRRVPLEVPSTYLWARTIEDLHVNSIWQRLRQSLLLFLQLLLIALLMIACLRPGWRGAELTGDRFIFMIDTSASMAATDVKPTRLDKAKQSVLELIEQMKTGDVAMVISFSNNARIEQPFTDNRRLLRQQVNRVKQTQRLSDLREALQAAAGLANPGRTSDPDSNRDIQVADAMPASVFIVSDGGFADVSDFDPEHLGFVYVPIGTDAPRNVGITAFTADRNQEKQDQTQALVNIDNPLDEDVDVEVSIFLNDELLDAANVTVPAGSMSGAQFDLADLEQGVLRAEIQQTDDLSADNVAYAAINSPRRANVLLVTPRNEALEFALKTDEAVRLAFSQVATPDVLTTKEFKDKAAAGVYDLIIFDQCVPEEMPHSNTLFIGRLPPQEGWKRGEMSDVPLIIDTANTHPLMQFIDFGNVNIAQGFSITPPEGGIELVSANIGSIFAIGPRDGFEDAVLGLEILRAADGKVEKNTDWPWRRSFPVFIINALSYLGGASGTKSVMGAQPGDPVTLRTVSPVEKIAITPPQGQKAEVGRDARNAFVFTATGALGVYDVREGEETSVAQRFAVNLFDSRESDLTTRAALDIGHEAVTGTEGVEPARKELWKWLLLAGLVVLIFEWYVFNRRVYF